MKLTSGLLTILILIAGCGKKEAVWNDLSTADRNAIRARAYNECIAESKSDFANFKTRSAAVYTSDDWEQGDGWLHTYNNITTTPTTVDRNHTILVWKRSATNIYLVVTRSINSDTLTYFVRIPKDDNAVMITNIQTAYCNKSFSMSTGTGLSTAKAEYETSDNEGNKDFTDTHTFDHDYPAFVGQIWNFARVQVTTDSDNKKTTKKFSSTFAKISNPADLKDDYTDYDQQLFCDLPATFVLPYNFNPSNCSATVPVTWTDFP